MDDADDDSARASLIQSLRGLPAETAADPLAESLLDNDSQADFERLFDVSAAAKPTDLAAASKKFAGVLEASASNVRGPRGTAEPRRRRVPGSRDDRATPRQQLHGLPRG